MIYFKLVEFFPNQLLAVIVKEWGLSRSRSTVEVIRAAIPVNLTTLVGAECSLALLPVIQLDHLLPGDGRAASQGLHGQEYESLTNVFVGSL